MSVDVDYYAVLAVARNADAGAIEAAVKKSMREWRKRTEAADLSVRQEAEVRVKQIENARSTLSDAARRSAYDRELAGGVKTATPAGGVTPSSEGWVDQAERYLAAGDYHSAAYAGREATRVDGTDARTWWVRSRANAGLDLWQDALYEGKQAVELEEGNADFHFNVGLIHEEIQQWSEAIASYRRAGSCDPSRPLYELAVGGVYLANGRPKEALPIIEAVYQKHPEDEGANFYLGSTLVEIAEGVPQKQSSDGYWVSSQAEIAEMRALALRAKGLNKPDADTKRVADHVLTYLDRMEQKAFRSPRRLIQNFVGSADSCGGLLFLVFLIGILMFLPLILVVSGLGTVGQNPGAGLLLIAIGGGLGYLYFRLSWIPRWKHNQKDLA